jgi:GTP-binding protein
MKVEVLDAGFVSAARDPASLSPPAFAEVAFAGRSNVGKSSLINALTQRRKLVRTSGTPGATRGINTFRLRLRLDGAREARVDFVDLPGYGYAQRSKAERRSWGPLMETFFRQREGLRAVVVIVDARRGLQDDDRELLDFLTHVGRTPLLVVTKVDKLGKSARAGAVQRVSKQAAMPALPFSATDGIGRDALWDRILDAAHVAGAPDAQG